MGGWLESLGYETGRQEANKVRKALRDMPPRQIPAFVGKALTTYRKATPSFESKQPSWAVGFWDGYLDRAEEIRKDP